LGTFAGSVVWSTLRSRSDGSDQRASGRYQAVTAAAAGTIVSCLVIVGLVAVFGTAVGPLLLLCLLGCAVRLARQLRERFGVLLNRNGFTATRSTAATVVEHQMVTLNELPTEALCRAWRRSYSRLQQATALPVREQLVLERERMLDELQRRAQEGFARWLGQRGSSWRRPQPLSRLRQKVKSTRRAARLVQDRTGGFSPAIYQAPRPAQCRAAGVKGNLEVGGRAGPVGRRDRSSPALPRLSFSTCGSRRSRPAAGGCQAPWLPRTGCELRLRERAGRDGGYLFTLASSLEGPRRPVEGRVADNVGEPPQPLYRLRGAGCSC
jgi:hypothetical protein